VLGALKTGYTIIVSPAKAGVQIKDSWIPAPAGMTRGEHVSVTKRSFSDTSVAMCLFTLYKKSCSGEQDFFIWSNGVLENISIKPSRQNLGSSVMGYFLVSRARPISQAITPILQYSN
jgi:hypothetical protein